MNIKKLLSFVVFLSAFVSVNAYAQDWQPVVPASEEVNSKIMSSFTSVTRVPSVNITVPTVVEVDFDANAVTGTYFAVYDDKAKNFIASYYISKLVDATRVIRVQDTITGKDTPELYDRNLSTSKDYYLLNNKASQISFSVGLEKPIKASSYTLSLDRNVSLPTSITVEANINGKWVVVINKVRPTGASIVFPPTTASDWFIQIDYSQPIRITDMAFNNEVSSVSKKSVRFLALPNNSYTVYANPERRISSYIDTLETYSLSRLASARSLGMYTLSQNMFFTETDSDADGVPDLRDNCKMVSNKDQKDEDSNGIGDLCDDYDKDYVANNVDNCIDVPNMDQRDTDGDKIGDKCDSDESRLTEKYPIVVWGGIFFAFLVFVVLLFVAGKKIKDNNSNGGVDMRNANTQ